MRNLLFLLGALFLVPAMSSAETVNLYAAGSLRAALTDVAQAYQRETGSAVKLTFAPFGLLRGRIEKGEPAQVFASANMKHPLKLAGAGWGGPVALFARNQLCAIAQPGLHVSEATLLDVLLDGKVRVGTSTPKADPSGDYAWELFRRAGKARAGAHEKLDAKALKLTGGPTSAKPPKGRNNYGWVMEKGKADVFLTYCTNAVLARREVPGLQIVSIPPALAVGADYGLIVGKEAPTAAWRFALYILSPPAQRILSDYGFVAAGVPTK